MTTTLTTFEEYLKDVHAKDYRGYDDDMPDDFERWLGNLYGEAYMQYAEEALHQQREMMRKDLLKIAGQGEYEDLRREVENYFLLSNKETEDGSVRCCDNGDMDEKHECLKSNKEI